jgi:UTP-glucose-1-phosphate uridylyltransferase
MRLPEKMKDNINPDHYKGEIQCIDAIKASMTHQEFKAYLKGNCIKYLWRYEKKHDDVIEDLRKAWWCLQRLIDENID